MDKTIEVSDGMVAIGDIVYCISRKKVRKSVLLRRLGVRDVFLMELALFDGDELLGTSVIQNREDMSNTFIDRRKAELYCKLKK